MSKEHSKENSEQDTTSRTESIKMERVEAWPPPPDSGNEGGQKDSGSSDQSEEGTQGGNEAQVDSSE